MKKEDRAPKDGASSHPLIQRVNGKISPKQYVRGLDERINARRKDTISHRRSK